MNIGKNRADRGAALVEAAMVLPIILMLTFGLWTTARAWNVHNTMEHAAREGARHGATIDPWNPGTSDVEVRGVVDDDLSASAIDPANVATTCIELIADTATSCDGDHTNTTGTDQVFVRVAYPNYELNFLFFSMQVDLEATAISRFEATP